MITNNEQILLLLIKHTPSAIAMFDNDMRYIAYSDRWLRDYNLGDQNLTGRSHYEVFPDIKEEWKADHQRVLNGEVYINPEDHWIRDDGTDVYIRYELRPWNQNDGSVGGIIMLTEVITEIVQTRKNLEKRNDELNSIFDAFPDLFFRLDKDGTYLDYKAGLKAPMLPPDQFMGKKIKEVMPPPMADTFMSLLNQALETKTITRTEYSIPKDEGIEHFEVRFLPLLNDEVLAVIRDVTQLNKQKEELKYTLEELRRTNLDLEQFAYIASHDLKEPIRMISTFSQLLDKQYGTNMDSTAQEYINTIRGGALRMQILTNNLLDYSRVGRLESDFRRIDLKDQIEQQLLSLALLVQEKSAQVTFGEFPNTVFCEPNQIGIVAYNLLNNALKFNDSNPAIININYDESPTHHIVSIEDNGIGIDKSKEEKVFKIFQRLHSQDEYEGTGIGLALCKKIIDRHEGEISFSDNLMKGTTFNFTIKKVS